MIAQRNREHQRLASASLNLYLHVTCTPCDSLFNLSHIICVFGCKFNKNQVRLTRPSSTLADMVSKGVRWLSALATEDRSFRSSVLTVSKLRCAEALQTPVRLAPVNPYLEGISSGLYYKGKKGLYHVIIHPKLLG